MNEKGSAVIRCTTFHSNATHRELCLLRQRFGRIVSGDHKTDAWHLRTAVGGPLTSSTSSSSSSSMCRGSLVKTVVNQPRPSVLSSPMFRHRAPAGRRPSPRRRRWRCHNPAIFDAASRLSALGRYSEMLTRVSLFIEFYIHAKLKGDETPCELRDPASYDRPKNRDFLSAILSLTVDSNAVGVWKYTFYDFPVFKNVLKRCYWSALKSLEVYQFSTQSLRMSRWVVITIGIWVCKISRVINENVN